MLDLALLSPLFQAAIAASLVTGSGFTYRLRTIYVFPFVISYKEGLHMNLPRILIIAS